MRKSPSTLIDLTGKQMGFWKVIERVPNKYGKVYYHCRCRCGTERDVGAQQLRQNKSQSCGCYGMQRTPKKRPSYHGKRWTEEEKEVVRTWYPIGGKRKVRQFIGRTPEAINSMAKKLGVRTGRPLYPRNDKWCRNEIDRLKKLYTEGGMTACRDKFRGRTYKAIKWKAATDLKLKSPLEFGNPLRRKTNEAR